MLPDAAGVWNRGANVIGRRVERRARGSIGGRICGGPTGARRMVGFVGSIPRGACAAVDPEATPEPNAEFVERALLERGLMAAYRRRPPFNATTIWAGSTGRSASRPSGGGWRKCSTSSSRATAT